MSFENTNIFVNLSHSGLALIFKINDVKYTLPLSSVDAMRAGKKLACTLSIMKDDQEVAANGN